MTYNEARECDYCGEIKFGVRADRRGVGDSATCHECYASDLDHGIKHGLCSVALRAALLHLARCEDTLEARLHDGTCDLLVESARASVDDAIEACDAIEEADDEPLPYCDFCHTSGHDVVDCADIDEETLAIELYERDRCRACGMNPCAKGCEGC